MAQRHSYTYRGCSITPQSGQSRYFGENKKRPYQTKWWKITFPNATWIIVANLTAAQRYINGEQGKIQGEVTDPRGGILRRVKAA